MDYCDCWPPVADGAVVNGEIDYRRMADPFDLGQSHLETVDEADGWTEEEAVVAAAADSVVARGVWEGGAAAHSGGGGGYHGQWAKSGWRQ